MSDLFTLPYAEVIGDPISQSKSPVIHGFWLDKLGIEAEYRAVRVRANGLEAYFDSRRGDRKWRGCNVTIPHKQSVLPLIDAPLRTAQRVGAVNCVYRARTGLGGENSDVEGVLDAIGAGAMQRDPGITCVIGAGGAARAALHALEIAGATELRLVVRRPERAAAVLDHMALSAQVMRLTEVDTALRDVDTVINASPLGMTGQAPMPAPLLAALALTAPGALVFDMVYAPLETELLAAARRLGRRPVDGLAMLIGQADLAFNLFFQAQAPRAHDAQLRTLLTA